MRFADEADSALARAVAAAGEAAPPLGADMRGPATPQLAVVWPATRVLSALELAGAVIVRNHGLRASDKSRRQRRERHNANERRRTNATKAKMRADVLALERQRLGLCARSASAPSRQRAYIALFDTVDRLRRERQFLEDRIARCDAQHSIFQAFLTELSCDLSQKLTIRHSEALEPLSEGKEIDNYGVHPDTVQGTPAYLKVLFDAPLSANEAFAWVQRSYHDIIALKNHTQLDSSGATLFGWRDRRVLDAECLQFMFTQVFPGVSASELVHKTWPLLTRQSLYYLIQPRMRSLRVLQRISDDCVVVQLSVASVRRDADDAFHSIMVIARGRIDGGYLVSYRSIPLSASQTKFADAEGSYVSVFNWFIFLDKAPGGCEVIFGGRVANRSPAYLRYITMEVVAGVVRWQSAVGQSRLRLASSE